MAFDLFLGKPAVIVEHHGYFRNGYRPIEEYAAAVNRLDPALTWGSPATICAQACLEKNGAGGRTDVRFYTDAFVLTNPEDKPRSYMMQRQDLGAVNAITSNSAPVPWEVQDGYVTFPLELLPKAAARIIIERPKPELAGDPVKPGLLYRSKVLARRRMSDFRDNFLDKNPAAKRFALRALGLVRGHKS